MRTFNILFRTEEIKALKRDDARGHLNDTD